MKLILYFLIICALNGDSKYKIDFGTHTGGNDWMLVTDRVVGGQSQAKARMFGASIQFKGVISLSNKGGFASIRYVIPEKKLIDYKSVNIRFKSKGREFSFVLESSQRFYNPQYKHAFSSNGQDWEIVTLNLSDFEESKLGKITDEHLTPEKLEDIYRIGIVLNDKKAGDFEIDIDYVEFE